jgi:colanic acid/amylovoran biosynthesis protein
MTCAPRKLRTLTRRYGVVFGDEIDGVVDVSGYAYGKPWSNQRRDETAADIERLDRRGKPYVFLPQAFGSFDNSDRSTRVFRRALARSRLIYARDTISLGNVRSLLGELPANLRLCPDFTMEFPLAGSKASRQNLPNYDVIVVPNTKLLSGPKAASVGDWEKFLANAIVYLTGKGMAIAIANHCRDEDGPFCARLASRSNADLLTASSPEELKSILATPALVISGRYHACISAMSQGVPCIGLSWSHKYRELFRDFGADDFVMDRPDGDTLHKILDRIDSKRDDLTTILCASTQTMQEKVDVMWKDVAAALTR